MLDTLFIAQLLLFVLYVREMLHTLILSEDIDILSGEIDESTRFCK